MNSVGFGSACAEATSTCCIDFLRPTGPSSLGGGRQRAASASDHRPGRSSGLWLHLGQTFFGFFLDKEPSAGGSVRRTRLGGASAGRMETSPLAVALTMMAQSTSSSSASSGSAPTSTGPAGGK